MTVVAKAAGVQAWRHGGKVRRSERFPPPDTKVIKDTVILTGEAARSRGRTMQALGAALVLLASGLVLLCLRLIAAFSADAI